MSKKHKITLYSLTAYLTTSFIAGGFNNGTTESIAILMFILLIHQVPLDNVLSYFYNQKMHVGTVWVVDYLPEDEDNQEERKLGLYIHTGLLVIFTMLWIFFLIKN